MSVNENFLSISGPYFDKKMVTYAIVHAKISKWICPWNLHAKACHQHNWLILPQDVTKNFGPKNSLDLLFLST